MKAINAISSNGKMLVVIIVLVASGCIGQQSFGGIAVNEASFAANDSVQLTGYIGGKAGGKPVILLHSLGSNSSEWSRLIERLAGNYTVFALDMRGHGKSSGNYNLFSESDYMKMLADVEAAKQFLASRFINTSAVYLIGSDIGANIALRYAASDKTVKGVIILSPGIDYKGVRTDDAIKDYAGPLLIIVGSEDAYAAQSSRRLIADAPAGRLQIYHGAQHGTGLLEREDAMDFVLSWIRGGWA